MQILFKSKSAPKNTLCICLLKKINLSLNRDLSGISAIDAALRMLVDFITAGRSLTFRSYRLFYFETKSFLLYLTSQILQIFLINFTPS
jgi:hypothetical protein